MTDPPPTGSNDTAEVPSSNPPAAAVAASVLPPPPTNGPQSASRCPGVECTYCHRKFINLNGHCCAQRRAALHKPPPVRPNVVVPLPNWPFARLAEVSYDDIFCCPLTIRAIPSGDADLFSAVVSELIGHILKGEKEAWKAFFILPRLVFALPRGGKDCMKLVHTNLALFRAGEWDSLLKNPFRRIQGKKGIGNCEKRAMALARAGFFSGATRALSRCEVADPADDIVYEALKTLHPAPSRLAAAPVSQPLQVITSDLFQLVVSKIRPYLSPDAAGWRGDYFRSLLPAAVDDCFKLVDFILRNPKSLPTELCPYFFGARVTPVRKRHGGIRPIAVGIILRKIISAALARVIAPQLPDFFCPLQFGAGVPGGPENVVHGLRLAQALSPDNVVVGLDFSNAFNSLERCSIAAEVEDKFPQVRTWYEMCYGQTSYILVNDRAPILSQRGVQQGDPLGPFFFALAIQPILKKAAEFGSCVLAYLDDIHICGDPAQVTRSVELVIREAAKIGLTCNIQKCWATKQLVVFGDSLPVDPKPFVLGAPLDVTHQLSSASIPTELLDSVAKLPDLQISLHLLRYIHNSHLTYAFRLSSEAASRKLADDMMLVTRSTLSRMLHLNDLPDHSWCQALLPKGPGLGFTNLSAMAPYMAYASILENSQRLASMRSSHFGRFASLEGWSSISDSAIFPLFRQALNVAQSTEGIDIEHAKLQHQFAARIVKPKALRDFVNDSSIPSAARAVVKSTANSPIANQFFHAIPTRKCLSLPSEPMRISLCILLSVSLDMVSAQCPRCNRAEPLDVNHALSCKDGGLIARHENVKDELSSMCAAGDLVYSVEPKHMFHVNNARPDLLVRFGSNDGHDIAFDITIVNPVRSKTAIAATLKDEQQFLRSQASVKNNKYQSPCAKRGTVFCPIVLSAFGGVLYESFQTGLKLLIHKVKKSKFVSPNWAAPDRASYWLQRIAIALWTSNAAKVSPFLRKEPLWQL